MNYQTLIETLEPGFSAVFFEGQRPLIVKDTQNKVLNDLPKATDEVLKSLIRNIVKEGEYYQFLKDKKIRFTSDVSDENEFLQLHARELGGQLFVEVFKKTRDEDLKFFEIRTPQIFNNWTEQKRGLVVLCSKSGQGLELLIKDFWKKRLELFSGSMLCSESSVKFSKLSNEALIVQTQFDESCLKFDWDHVFLSSMNTNKEIPYLNSFLNLGSFCFVHMNVDSIEQGFVKFYSLFANSMEQYGVFNHLLGFVGHQEITAEKGRISVFELCPFDHIDRKNLLTSNFKESLKHFENTFEKKGLKKEQSLHQLVLTRVLSVREAFIYSQKPEYLDRLLTDTGI